MKNRDFYIDNIQEGNIVAFTIGDNMYSGKVVSIIKQDEKLGSLFTIKTKNGSVYYVHPVEIVWVKTGSHWPNGIFNALKESRKGESK